MKGETNRKKSSESGTVLVEYVFLLLIVVFDMLIWGNKFYNAADGLGPIGEGMQAAWQRVIETVALPVP